MKKGKRIFFAAAIPAAVFIVILLREQIIGLKRFLPICTFHTLTGYLCAGCGNTRCVTHLLHGEIISAIRCNITIPFLFFLLILFYAENTAALIGKDVKLIPRRPSVWYAVTALFVIYFIVRNFIPEIAPI